MRDVKIAVLFFSLFCLFLTLNSTTIASTSLSSYEATFEVIANSKDELRDIKVKLKITYNVLGKLKKRGKKFIEARPIEEVQVTDGEGKPLRFDVSNSGKRYSKISWYFSSITEGEQVVVIRFKLPNAITIKEEKNYFWAYWVGSWLVPVDKALYRFIFPPGYSYQECSVYPQYKYEEKLLNERRQVEVSIAPLRGESFALAFSPSFVEWEKSFTTEKKLPQLMPSASEVDIKELDVKDEEEEEKKEEIVKDEKGGMVNAVLLTSSTTTTIDLSHERRGEEQTVNEEAKRIYDSAQELFQQERYREALSNLRYFMDKYPRSEIADVVSFLIGDCYFHLAEEGLFNSYQPAIDAFQLALALYPDSKKVPRGLFQLANSYRVMQYHYEASENYKLLISTYPHAECIPDAHFWIAENHFQNDEFREARNRFQNFIIKYPQNDRLKQAVFRVADCCVGLKKYGKAQRGYEEALSRWPDYSHLFPETLFYLGLAYLKSGDYTRARSAFFTGLNVFPEEDYNHIILTKIGDTYRMEKEVKGALKVYSQNSVLYPESKGAISSEIKMADIGVENLGFFSFDQSLNPLKIYQGIIKKYPVTDHAEEALYKQGFAFSEQEKYQEAIISLKTILEEYPDSDLSKRAFYSVQDILCKLIDSYFSEGKYYFVIDAYQKNRSPFLDDLKDAKALFQVGESFRQAGFYDEALEIYREARRIYPRNYPDDALILGMGEIYMLKRKYAEAEKLFRKVIKDFPKSECRKLALHSLADTYFEQGEYGDAQNTYLLALEGKQKIPRDIKGFFYLGKCYQSIGNSSLATEAYGKAIQVAEDLGKDNMDDEFVVRSYLQMADYLYQTRQYLDAIKVYTQAVERYPEDDRIQWALYRIAASYREAGKGVDEIKSFKKLVDEGSREAFWEKVISENIRNLEWEVGNRENFVP